MEINTNIISRPIRHLLVRAVLAVIGFFPLSIATAQQEIVDRVVAVVEDDAIFQSDIDQMVKQVIFQRGIAHVSDEEREELEKQALDELISNKLVVAQAGRLGVDVSFAEVEQMVEKAIEENKRALGGEEGFNRQLKAEGLTLDDLKRLYREQLRNRLLVERVLAAEINRQSVQVPEAEVRKAYEERRGEAPWSSLRPAVVHLGTIFFGFESSEHARAVAKARIEEIGREVKAGGEFTKLAQQYSEDPSAARGGDLGDVNLADLRDVAFVRAAAKLTVGEISEPVLTSYGYHLIQKVDADTSGQVVHLRHILVRVKPDEKGIQKVFEKATSVRNRLASGAPFDSMAVRYSDDPLSAPNGGDIGWLKLQDLPEFFRDVLTGMERGDISQVLRESTGFRIVKLLDREDARPYKYEEVRDELKRVLEQEKLNEAYDRYLRNLRERFYVDVRV